MKKIKDCENFSDVNINMTIQFQVLTVHTMASIFIHVTTVSAKRTHQQVIPQKRTQTKQVEGFTHGKKPVIVLVTTNQDGTFATAKTLLI